MTSFSKPVLELRPVEAPSMATPGACVYMLLPTFEELVGLPDFGRGELICLPASPRPFDPWAFFAQFRPTATVTLH